MYHSKLPGNLFYTSSNKTLLTKASPSPYPFPAPGGGEEEMRGAGADEICVEAFYCV